MAVVFLTLGHPQKVGGLAGRWMCFSCPLFTLCQCLTALWSVNSVNHIGLALPMMALVDVFGFRIVAIALCPLDSSTLIHGSADAGQTILSNDEAAEKFRMVASSLNLKEHQIRGSTLQLAVDVEGHAGRDGRLYVIDLSRIMPPQAPNRAYNPLSHLFQVPSCSRFSIPPLSLCETPSPLRCSAPSWCAALLCHCAPMRAQRL